MRKWLILIIVLLLVFIGYNYVYQDHRDIKKETATFLLSSIHISRDFSQDPIQSEAKYLDKTVEISGFITELNKNDLTLGNQVFCQFEKNIKQSLEIGSELIIKGRCIGYDDLLEQVKLDQCHIVVKP